MGSILTESPLGHEITSPSPVREPSGSSKTSQLTPVVFVIDANEVRGESLDVPIRSEGWYLERFTSVDEFLVSSREPVPSCLILDVSDPGCGLELQKRFAAERPHIPIIFLSNRGDLATTVMAMKAGAVEFFTKPVQVGELLSAIREAHEWSRFALDYEAEQRLLRESYESLSKRERQVMELVVSGLRNKQVGAELGISEITARIHRGQVMQKMKATSFADLVKMAAKLGLSRDLEMPMLRHNSDRAANVARQLFGSHALARWRKNIFEGRLPMETNASIAPVHPLEANKVAARIDYGAVHFPSLPLASAQQH